MNVNKRRLCRSHEEAGGLDGCLLVEFSICFQNQILENFPLDLNSNKKSLFMSRHMGKESQPLSATSQ